MLQSDMQWQSVRKIASTHLLPCTIKSYSQKQALRKTMEGDKRKKKLSSWPFRNMAKYTFWCYLCSQFCDQFSVWQLFPYICTFLIPASKSCFDNIAFIQQNCWRVDHLLKYCQQSCLRISQGERTQKIPLTRLPFASHSAFSTH